MLAELFSGLQGAADAPATQTPAAAPEQTPQADSAYTAEEEAAVEERLKDLGYL